MRPGKDLIGKPIISIDQGRRIGTVKDLFVDSDVRAVVGIYLGTEGFFSRKGLCVDRDNVVVYGQDAVLVRHSDAVVDSTPACESAIWRRADALHGQEVVTAGGTRVGTVDDILLDDQMRVIGFMLSRTYLTGPVADRRAIVREAVTDIQGDDVMIVDLSVAEQQPLPDA